MPMQIDRARLTEAQRKELDQWTEFFHGPVWKSLVQRYEPRIDALQQRYHQVKGEQELGKLQGALQAMYNIFVHLPDQINAEFLLVTGQLQEAIEQEGSDDDPVSPDNWQV